MLQTLDTNFQSSAASCLRAYGGAPWSDADELQSPNLREVSLMTFPANRETQVSVVKPANATKRDCKAPLRDAVLSKTEAKSLLAKVSTGAADRDDSVSTNDEQDLIAAIQTSFPIQVNSYVIRSN